MDFIDKGDINIDLQGILSGLKFDKDIEKEIENDMNIKLDSKLENKKINAENRTIKTGNKKLNNIENRTNKIDNKDKINNKDNIKIDKDLNELDFGIDIQLHKENRRAFSEKLENDPVFKQKYMDEQKAKLENAGKTINTDDEELELILKKLKNNTSENLTTENLMTEIEPIEDIDNESLKGSFIGKSPYSDNSNNLKNNVVKTDDIYKNLSSAGIFINNVQNLTINFVRN